MVQIIIHFVDWLFIVLHLLVDVANAVHANYSVGSVFTLFPLRLFFIAHISYIIVIVTAQMAFDFAELVFDVTHFFVEQINIFDVVENIFLVLACPILQLFDQLQQVLFLLRAHLLLLDGDGWFRLDCHFGVLLWLGMHLFWLMIVIMMIIFLHCRHPIAEGTEFGCKIVMVGVEILEAVHEDLKVLYHDFIIEIALYLHSHRFLELDLAELLHI